jgi:hypothetical protein
MGRAENLTKLPSSSTNQNGCAQCISVDNAHILIRAENTVIGHAQLLHFGLVPRIRFTSAYLKRSCSAWPIKFTAGPKPGVKVKMWIWQKFEGSNTGWRSVRPDFWQTINIFQQLWRLKIMFKFKKYLPVSNLWNDTAFAFLHVLWSRIEKYVNLTDQKTWFEM